jgi:hypothetical protein
MELQPLIEVQSVKQIELSEVSRSLKKFLSSYGSSNVSKLTLTSEEKSKILTDELMDKEMILSVAIKELRSHVSKKNKRSESANIDSKISKKNKNNAEAVETIEEMKKIKKQKKEKKKSKSNKEE